jgi:hypothetical protein
MLPKRRAELPSAAKRRARRADRNERSGWALEGVRVIANLEKEAATKLFEAASKWQEVRRDLTGPPPYLSRPLIAIAKMRTFT